MTEYEQLMHDAKKEFKQWLRSGRSAQKTLRKESAARAVKRKKVRTK
jgi:hypothetical protein